jgi:hypothetical protein
MLPSSEDMGITGFWEIQLKTKRHVALLVIMAWPTHGAYLSMRRINGSSLTMGPDQHYADEALGHQVSVRFG